MTADADLLELERAAFLAWPAAETEPLDGWVLRAMQGVTHRANSAWTAETRGPRTLAERISRVEAFYAARGLPSTVALCPLSPPALDAALDQRGYALDAPVAIQTAPVEAVALGAEYAVDVTREPSPAFLSVVVEHGRYARSASVFLGLLSRLGSSARYASVTLGGAPKAAGFGVLCGERFGIFGMRTLESARRRGLGQSVLRALAREGGELRARTLYLQVERDNPAALALYAKLGFVEAYGYHYRVRNPA